MAPWRAELRAFRLSDGGLVTDMLIIGVWRFEIWEGWNAYAEQPG